MLKAKSAIEYLTLCAASILMAAIMFASCSTSGCSAATTQDIVLRDATLSSNTNAALIEAMQSTALVMYRAEQEVQVSIAINKGETKDQAKSRVAIVRAQWAPVWDAFAKARLVHATLASLLASVSPGASAVQAAVNEAAQRMVELQAYMAAARSRAEGAQ